MGQLVDSDERWEFYKAQDFERPSKEELKYLKGIIIPSSDQQIKNKELKDKNLIKDILKRERAEIGGQQSEFGIDSSVAGASANTSDIQ